jgi:glycolate oxidase subunit GlcD
MPPLSDQLIRALTAAVGSDAIRTDRTALDTYSRDGLPTHRSRPGAVVLPGSHDEVVQCVRILHYHRVPFVARGAGTGLSGGALAAPDGVVVGLTRLNRVLAIDAVNRRAVVEPGVVNVRLSEAAAAYGLHYAPDPSSQTACTIGGNVAENAGGPHCLKYGVTTNHIVALTVVLPDGTVTDFGSASGEPWGPDLVSLFVGSEGMLGIATRITVRLTPSPRSVHTLLAEFTDLRQAGEAVSAIVRAGIVPAALEMMDRACIAAVEASIYAAGYPENAAAVLLVEVDGRDDEAVRAEAAAVDALLRDAGAAGIRSASDERERARLWQGRKKAFGAMGRINSDLVVQDAVVPRSTLPDVLETIGAIGERHRVRVANVFHAGDGNLHPNIAFDASDPDERERVEHASAEIMAACIAVGGTITGEHGVGLDKQRYMPAIFTPDALGAMHGVRLVFDPHQIANPGKMIPTHSCREWRSAPRLRDAETT